MKNYIENDQVEIAPSNVNNEKEFYLPQHAVKKIKQESTKWRVVFNPSSRMPNSFSLNDALEIGSNLLPDILSVLLRFRLHEQALTGDGTQAFLQLSLDERERDATRFFWFQTVTTPQGLEFSKDEVVTYRFQRLPFGLGCSPFLLSSTLRELATIHKSEFPFAAAEVHKNFYMDDILSSTQNEEDIVALYR
ncbi:uncharacterized protein LOC129219404 [Uloborus diversus]|uniref:uncharacterized protein LOC129219404 n=1 Tax=Uloborus diversus TaxID=327109 RepID=UPI002409B51F|nr:uncharacterized protein LOC129219404 [Uloborus diversus]